LDAPEDVGVTGVLGLGGSGNWVCLIFSLLMAISESRTWLTIHASLQ
jgi:hypothetical protein